MGQYHPSLSPEEIPIDQNFLHECLPEFPSALITEIQALRGGLLPGRSNVIIGGVTPVQNQEQRNLYMYTDWSVPPRGDRNLIILPNRSPGEIYSSGGVWLGEIDLRALETKIDGLFHHLQQFTSRLDSLERQVVKLTSERSTHFN